MSKYCKKCGCSMVKNGKRKLKYREVQQYLCRKCGVYDSDNDFPCMTYPKKVAEASSIIRHEGVPLKRVRTCVNKIFDITVKSASTIWYWTQRFGKMCSDTVFQNLASLLHLDETQVKTNKKGRKFYMWAIKCPKTKAIVTHISEKRNEKEAEAVLKKMKRRFPMGYIPKAIGTDSFSAYHAAIMHVFGYKVKHDKFKSFESHSNNEIETIFRCKRRFPRFVEINSARNYVGYWESNHNEEKLGDFFGRFLFILFESSEA